MKLYTINTGFFKLDGGAMFGVVPKSMWKKLNPSDDNNMCTWALRCLLVENGKQLILIDNGIGDKQGEKFLSHFSPFGDDTLEKSLASKGFSRDDITDVVISHLHFDHCGGSVRWNKDRTGFETAFKNATYWSNAMHWQWATKPNDREKASFLEENILPIKESGQLKFVPAPKSPEGGVVSLFDDFSIIFANGHTESLMLPQITYKGKKMIYMSDLIPSSWHISLPYIMGYDVRPLLTLKEKIELLNNTVENDGVLFFEHDPLIECCTLQSTDRGVRLKGSFQLSDW